MKVYVFEPEMIDIKNVCKLLIFSIGIQLSWPINDACQQCDINYWEII